MPRVPRLALSIHANEANAKTAPANLNKSCKNYSHVLGNRRCYTKSAETVQNNKDIWEKSLTQFKKSLTTRGPIKVVDSSLALMSRIPKSKTIIGRYMALRNVRKSRADRAKQIASELDELWTKLNIPSIKTKSIVRKVTMLLKKYDNSLKRPKKSETLSTLFDVTDPNGTWLSNQDKAFYKTQVESGGEVGYCTTALAPVHPSKLPPKRPQASVQESCSADHNRMDFCDSGSESSEPVHQPDAEEGAAGKRKREHATTKNAVNLVKKINLSTNKAALVCNQLKTDGIHLPTPTQSGIYKATFREADRIKKVLRETLKNEDWVLQFDGKKWQGSERQVVVVKNSRKEYRIAVLTLTSGKSDPIYQSLVEILDEYELWNNIKMIVADTCNVNTGRRIGVVTRLQRAFEERGLEAPQFVGCEHHILDRALKHVMNQLLKKTSSSPDISYAVIDDLVDQYEELVSNFVQTGTVLNEKNPGWTDDAKFLFELCSSYRYYQKHAEFNRIHFRKLPSLCDSRWNSRAILAILAFILMPEQRPRLRQLCDFISGDWMDLWFSDHKYDLTAFERASLAMSSYPKAAKTVEKFWNPDPSVLEDVERSNRCAERAVKVMKDLDCRSADKLNMKFLLSNRDL